MTSGIRKRILKGIGATGLGQVVTATIQLVSVPLFLEFWGVELYGEWLILSAIPAYFAISDIGFGSVAANEMTMLVAKDDRAGALQVFQSAWLFISGISLLIALVVLTAIWFLPLNHYLNLTRQTHFEISGIVSFLTLHVLVGLQGGLLAAGFRCEGRYALGTLLGNILRLADFGMVTVAVCFGASPLVAASIFLAMRVIGTMLIRLDLRKRSPWIVFGRIHARRATIKRLANPAIAFMGFPLGNALSIQGMRLVIGAVLGPTAVVVFTTLRTLTRFGFQLINMITNTVWPELSMAFGSKDMGLARKLHRYSCQASLWLAFCIVIGLLVTGEWIIRVWTLGKVFMDTTLFGLLLAVIIANSIWYASSAVPLAINRHQKMALFYMVGTGLSLLLATLLMPMWGMNGAAFSLLIIDVAMSSHVIRNSLALLEDRFGDFMATVVAPPAIHRLWKGYR